jgi:hypothetical protein
MHELGRRNAKVAYGPGIRLRALTGDGYDTTLHLRDEVLQQQAFRNDGAEEQRTQGRYNEDAVQQNGAQDGT